MNPRLELALAALLYTAVLTLSIGVVILMTLVWAATGDHRAGWALALMLTALVIAHVRLVEGWQR